MYTGAAQVNVITATENVIIITYYSFLKVYTLIYITLIVASHLFLVNINKPGTFFYDQLHFCIT